MQEGDKQEGGTGGPLKGSRLHSEWESRGRGRGAVEAGWKGGGRLAVLSVEASIGSMQRPEQL